MECGITPLVKQDSKNPGVQGLAPGKQLDFLLALRARDTGSKSPCRWL